MSDATGVTRSDPGERGDATVLSSPAAGGDAARRGAGVTSRGPSGAAVKASGMFSGEDATGVDTACALTEVVMARGGKDGGNAASGAAVIAMGWGAAITVGESGVAVNSGGGGTSTGGRTTEEMLSGAATNASGESKRAGCGIACVSDAGGSARHSFPAAFVDRRRPKSPRRDLERPCAGVLRLTAPLRPASLRDTPPGRARTTDSQQPFLQSGVAVQLPHGCAA